MAALAFVIKVGRWAAWPLDDHTLHTKRRTSPLANPKCKYIPPIEFPPHPSMEYESLAAWWPESDDPLAKAEGLPIFSPPPSIADLSGEVVGGMEPAEWLEGEGALGLGDPMQGVEENSGVNEGNAGGKGCKNLMSERKRRERINRQMIALRSLVPYMSRVHILNQIVSLSALSCSIMLHVGFFFSHHKLFPRLSLQ